MFLTVPALAEAPQAETPAPAGAVSSYDAHMNEVVCKRQPPPTGSRIAGKTLCMTNRDWLALWDLSQQMTNKMQDPKIGKNSGG